MEELGLNSMRPLESDFWLGKRVLITGHTGFKGSWLSLWLQAVGAKVHGLALAPPTDPNLFTEASVSRGMNSMIGDIRDFDFVRSTMAACAPEIVIHMAAQPLVRLSYKDPITTYSTNVMGTVHVLEAARSQSSVRCVVNVTSDKCYDNREWVWGYRENEAMGGHDPYSSSKGCAEIVTSAYRASYFQAGSAGLASARAGNVIGGGDWALDRLVPDILRAFERGESVAIRNPNAVRPWQHVLEPLSGYLRLAERLWADKPNIEGGWNFGPAAEDARSVQWLVEQMARTWGKGAKWKRDGGSHPHEAGYLRLDISKATDYLQWRPRWSLETALAKVVQWHQGWMNREDPRELCLSQIEEFSAASNRSAS